LYRKETDHDFIIEQKLDYKRKYAGTVQNLGLITDSLLGQVKIWPLPEEAGGGQLKSWILQDKACGDT
jgi:hypothetical protein